MIEVREVWRRYMLGEGLRAIARGTGLDRKTVAKFVQGAEALGLQRGGPPATDDQVAAIVAQVPVPVPAVPSDAIQALDVTSTYFAGLAEQNPQAQRGSSRDRRFACTQVFIASPYS